MQTYMKRMILQTLPAAGVLALQTVASAEKIQWAEMDRTEPAPVAVASSGAWPPSPPQPPVDNGVDQMIELRVLRGKR